MTMLRTLLIHAVDYAGLFPPAKLDMETAVRNYASYQEGEHSWALGRFIVPVSGLVEFEHALNTTARWGDNTWRISALADADALDRDMAAIFGFNKRQQAIIDTIELKASTVDGVKVISRSVPSVLTTYVEIPLDPDPAPLIAVIRSSGLCAKVRTGGITSGAFPSSRNLARFIQACTSSRVRFKATAGLHHPVRGEYHLTYETESETGTMYGFLNVLVASGVAYAHGSMSDIVAALEERTPGAFRFDDDGITWGTFRLDGRRIPHLRSELVNAFGSCSFTEPINDLKSLKIL